MTISQISASQTVSAAPTSILQRLGGGMFGAGTLGLIGLLSGFFVPLCVLFHIIMGEKGDGSLLPFIMGGVELFMSLLMALVHGAVGLVGGLLLGFIAGALGSKAGTPRRMVIALSILLIVAFGFALRAASAILQPTPTSAAQAYTAPPAAPVSAPTPLASEPASSAALQAAKGKGVELRKTEERTKKQKGSQP